MKNPYIGKCPICLVENKHLSTTKTHSGPITTWIRKCCDRCQFVIQIEIDHAVRILQADTYEQRYAKYREDKKIE